MQDKKRKRKKFKRVRFRNLIVEKLNGARHRVLKIVRVRQAERNECARTYVYFIARRLTAIHDTVGVIYFALGHVVHFETRRAKCSLASTSLHVPWYHELLYIYIYNILHIGETRVSKHSKFPKISYLIRVIIFPLIFPTLTLWYLYLFIFGSFKMA